MKRHNKKKIKEIIRKKYKNMRDSKKYKYRKKQIKILQNTAKMITSRP